LLKLGIHIVNKYNDFVNAFLCGYSFDYSNKAFSGLDEAIVFDGKNHRKSFGFGESAKLQYSD